MCVFDPNIFSLQHRLAWLALCESPYFAHELIPLKHEIGGAQRNVVLSGTTGEVDRRWDVSASVVLVKSGKGRVAPVA